MSVWEKLFLRKESSAEEKHSIGGSASEKNSAEFDLTLEGDEYANEQGETLRINQIHDGKIQVILNVKGAIPGVNLFDNKDAFDAFIRERGFQKKEEKKEEKGAEPVGHSTTTDDSLPVPPAERRKQKDLDRLLSRVEKARPIVATKKNQKIEEAKKKQEDIMRTLKEETKKSTYFPNDEIYENDEGGQIKIERQRSAGNLDPAVLYSERAPDGAVHDRRVREISPRNFEVVKRMKGMKLVDPLKIANPDFYSFYQSEMDKAHQTFTREYIAIQDALESWKEEIEETYKHVLEEESGEQKAVATSLQQKVESLQKEVENLRRQWDESDDSFVKGGLQRLDLLGKIRELAVQLPEEVENLRKEIYQEEKVEEPDAKKLQAEFLRAQLGQQEKELEEKVIKVERKLDAIAVGKLPKPHNMEQILEAVKEINKLLEAPRDRAGAKHLQKVTAKLSSLEEALAFDYAGARENEERVRKEKGKKTRKFRGEKDEEKNLQKKAGKKTGGKKKEGQENADAITEESENSDGADEVKALGVTDLWEEVQALGVELGKKVAKIDNEEEQVKREGAIEEALTKARAAFEDEALSKDEKENILLAVQATLERLEREPETVSAANRRPKERGKKNDKARELKGPGDKRLAPKSKKEKESRREEKNQDWGEKVAPALYETRKGLVKGPDYMELEGEPAVSDQNEVPVPNVPRPPATVRFYEELKPEVEKLEEYRALRDLLGKVFVNMKEQAPELTAQKNVFKGEIRTYIFEELAEDFEVLKKKAVEMGWQEKEWQEFLEKFFEEEYERI